MKSSQVKIPYTTAGFRSTCVTPDIAFLMLVVVLFL